MDDPNQTPSPQQDPTIPQSAPLQSGTGPALPASVDEPVAPPVIPTSPPPATEIPQAPPPISDFEERSFFAGKLPLAVGIVVLLVLVAGGFYAWQTGFLGGNKEKTSEVQVITPARVIPPPPPPARQKSGFETTP